MSTDRPQIDIGSFTLDARRNVLIHAGQESQVEPKIVQVLLTLASKPGEVFSRDRLISEVWEREYGADESLTRAISQLRGIFGDKRGMARYIETVPKTGYRLTAPVVMDNNNHRGQTPTGVSRRLVYLLVLGLILVAVAGFILNQYPFRTGTQPSDDTADRPVAAVENSKSIAVLPFDNRSDRDEDRFFVSGVHDDLLGQLARISQLKVISRTSVLEYRDRTANLRQIGQELGVATVLEGAVQRSGDTVRITVQLIDAQSDAHLWAGSYDRELSSANIFNIQREIAVAIAGALQAELSLEEEAALAEIPTQNLRAYDLFQHARQIRLGEREGSWSDALGLYQEAIVEDPGFAAAYANIGRLHLDQHWYFSPDPIHLKSARRSIDRALELDPDLPEAHIALGDYYYRGFLDYDQALAQLELARSPGNAELHLKRGAILRRRGDTELAIRSFARALDLNPRYAALASTYAQTLSASGHHQRAAVIHDLAYELAPDSFSQRVRRAHTYLALDINSPALDQVFAEPRFKQTRGRYWVLYRWWYAQQIGDLAMAMETIEQSKTDPLSLQFIYYPLALMRGLSEYYLGDPANAQPLFAESLKTIKLRITEAPEDYRAVSAASFAHAGLGNREEALAHAQAARDLMPLSRDAGRGQVFVFYQAKIHAMLGDHQAAIDTLEELFSNPVNWSENLPVVLRDPAFSALRPLPEFQAFVAKHQFRASSEGRAESE